MSTLLKQFKRWRKIASNLTNDTAPQRLSIILNFLESEPVTKSILGSFSELVPSILPSSLNPKATLGMGLYLMKECRSSGLGLLELAERCGIIPSNPGATPQQYLDEVVNGFISPFLDYVEAEIESHPESQANKGGKSGPPSLKNTRTSPTRANMEYIDSTRIRDLDVISKSTFDLRKLIRLCEEMNLAFRYSCHFSLIVLTRAILDHVPPIFGVKTFSEVANKYSGSKSFKESMKHLSESSRKIADAHLHTQIRNKESLPTFTQVNFSNDLDVLLAEIIRILK